VKIDAYLPLEITVTSYSPATPGRSSGPPEDCYPGESAEIEFEVRTRTGHELSESDFGQQAWKDVCEAVLEQHEDEIENARAEAHIAASEAAHAY
jgi:hypothetical protein